MSNFEDSLHALDNQLTEDQLYRTANLGTASDFEFRCDESNRGITTDDDAGPNGNIGANRSSIGRNPGTSLVVPNDDNKGKEVEWVLENNNQRERIVVDLLTDDDNDDDDEDYLTIKLPYDGDESGQSTMDEDNNAASPDFLESTRKRKNFSDGVDQSDPTFEAILDEELLSFISEIVDLSQADFTQKTSEEEPNNSNMPEKIIPATNEAVRFGWIKHPATTKWRDAVKMFSDDRCNYPGWSDGICDEVKQFLAQRGINQFLICADSDNKPFKRIWDRDKQSLGTWRLATNGEVLEKTKQRFIDGRRQVKQPINKRSRGRPPKPRNVESSNILVDRLHRVKYQPATWYPMAENCVCFEWERHHGTTRWRKVVKELADNTQLYPKWDDEFTNVVKAKLAMEGITFFLIFLDSESNPCNSIHDGLWYIANENDIITRTKQQFLDRRRENYEETPNYSSVGKPPNGSSLTPENYTTTNQYGVDDPLMVEWASNNDYYYAPSYHERPVTPSNNSKSASELEDSRSNDAVNADPAPNQRTEDACSTLPCNIRGNEENDVASTLAALNRCKIEPDNNGENLLLGGLKRRKLGNDATTTVCVDDVSLPSRAITSSDSVGAAKHGSNISESMESACDSSTVESSSETLATLAGTFPHESLNGSSLSRDDSTNTNSLLAASHEQHMVGALSKHHPSGFASLPRVEQLHTSCLPPINPMSNKDDVDASHPQTTLQICEAAPPTQEQQLSDSKHNVNTHAVESSLPQTVPAVDKKRDDSGVPLNVLDNAHPSSNKMIISKADTKEKLDLESIHLASSLCDPLHLLADSGDADENALLVDLLSSEKAQPCALESDYDNMLPTSGENKNGAIQTINSGNSVSDDWHEGDSSSLDPLATFRSPVDEMLPTVKGSMETFHRTCPVVAGPNDVCFKAAKHPGTVRWREVVRRFSEETEKWNENVCTMIIEQLARMGITRFLVSLDDHGHPSKKIRDGSWYLATDQEILDRTKQRFLDNRKQERSERANSDRRPLGRPKKSTSIKPPDEIDHTSS